MRPLRRIAVATSKNREKYRAVRLPAPGQALVDASRGQLDLSHAVTRVVPLEASAIDGVLDGLEAFGDGARSVIRP